MTLASDVTTEQREKVTPIPGAVPPDGWPRVRGRISAVKGCGRFGFVAVRGKAEINSADVCFLDVRQMREPEAMAVGVDVEFTRMPAGEKGKRDLAIDAIVYDRQGA